MTVEDKVKELISDQDYMNDLIDDTMDMFEFNGFSGREECRSFLVETVLPEIAKELLT